MRCEELELVAVCEVELADWRAGELFRIGCIDDGSDPVGSANGHAFVDLQGLSMVAGTLA